MSETLRNAPRATVSIVIVSYNNMATIDQCLNAVRVGQGVAADVGIESATWVVDNDSWDGTADHVESAEPWATVVRCGENLGFSRANNIVLKDIESDYVLILNPDTAIGERAIQDCVSYLNDHPDVGMVGGRLEYPDGRLDPACKRGMPTPLNALSYFLHLDRLFPWSPTIGGYQATHLDSTRENDVEAIVGAFMFVRRRVFEEIGLFDEDYFMYGEDLDLCLRVREAGWRIVYYPSVTAIHHKGVSSGLKEHSSRHSAADLETKRRTTRAFHRSMLIFYRKHYQGRYPRAVDWLVSRCVELREWLAVRQLDGARHT